MLVLAAALTGYLLGAVPTGVIVARLYGGVDLTQVGSRRTGATNVLRTLGKKAAAAVFTGDLLKGVLAVLVGGWIAGGEPWAQAIAGFAAVLGHSYSPFLGLKGGRGVATGFGALLTIAPLPALAALVVGIITIAASRYVSLGSILGTLTAAIIESGLMAAGQVPLAHGAFSVAVATFIVVAHRDNIQRLRSGTERKLGQRA